MNGGKRAPSKGDQMIAEVIATAAFACGAGTPRASTAPTAMSATPASVPARQVFTWKWTDGSRKTERVFRKSLYGSVDKIPKFEVKVYPAYPPWNAKLLFWVNGTWVSRQTQRSDNQGRMRMTFDPRGPDGHWEDITWIVRIRLKDISTTRTASIAPRAAVEELRLTVRYVSL